MSYPAAENVAELLGINVEESEFAECVLWYDGFKGERMKLLPYESNDVAIIQRKMESSRAGRDFKTADTLREVLRKAGFDVKNKGL